MNPPKRKKHPEIEHNSSYNIYIYTVGPITWQHFGHFKVNNLATSRSISWPPFFEPIKIGFLCSLSGPVLRDTARLSQRYPPIARYGVFGVSTWPIGCDTPSPFSERFPLEYMRSRGAIPPLKRGISAILARYPMKTRQMGAIPPSAILSRKGIARYGGVSRTGPLSV